MHQVQETNKNARLNEQPKKQEVLDLPVNFYSQGKKGS